MPVFLSRTELKMLFLHRLIRTILGHMDTGLNTHFSIPIYLFTLAHVLLES